MDRLGASIISREHTLARHGVPAVVIVAVLAVTSCMSHRASPRRIHDNRSATLLQRVVNLRPPSVYVGKESPALWPTGPSLTLFADRMGVIITTSTETRTTSWGDMDANSFDLVLRPSSFAAGSNPDLTIDRSVSLSSALRILEFLEDSGAIAARILVAHHLSDGPAVIGLSWASTDMVEYSRVNNRIAVSAQEYAQAYAVQDYEQCDLMVEVDIRAASQGDTYAFDIGGLDAFPFGAGLDYFSRMGARFGPALFCHRGRAYALF